MSKVFVISDTHFGDGVDEIIGFENRPFKSSKEMEFLKKEMACYKVISTKER